MGFSCSRLGSAARCAFTASSSSAKRPSASALASTTVTTPSTVTRDLISGQLKARTRGCGSARREVPLEQLLHRRHEIIRDGAADAAIGELDDILLAAHLIAAAFEDLAIDA